MHELELKSLLRSNGIPFVTRGVNVGTNALCVHCPYCGQEDHSFHLRIKNNSRWFRCWRNPGHSGLVINLLKDLGISVTEEQGNILQQLINKTFFEPEVARVVETKQYKKITELPIEFVSIVEDSVFSRPYLEYLRKRGFTQPKKLAKEYNLRRSLLAGNYAARIIVPVQIDGEYSWVARSIGDNPVRYLTPAEGEARSIKDFIGLYNELVNTTGDTLIITEGVFDALKPDFYLKPQVRATCIFGLSATDRQLNLLTKVCGNFKKILIGLDAGADTIPQKLALAASLSQFQPVIMKLPAKDLGEMEPQAIKKLLETYS